MLASSENAQDLVALTQLVESAAAALVIDRTYPQSQAPEAIRYLAAGDARGEVVITV